MEGTVSPISPKLASPSSHFCLGQKLTVTDIKALLKDNTNIIEVAIVMSCHSQSIGEILRKSGIKHVICIKRDVEILDKACIIFTSEFYKHLIEDSYKTVCDAFKYAQNCVKSSGSINNSENVSNRFICLHNHAKKRFVSFVLTYF